MTFGLLIRNGASQVVIDSELTGLASKVRGTVITGPVQSSGVATGASPGKKTGYSVVRLYVSGSIVIGVQLPADWYVSIISISYGSGYADVTLNAGYGLDADGFIATQAVPAIWAFGTPDAIYGAWGLALYNASGVLTHDFSSPYLFYPRGYGVSTNQSGFIIPSLSNPVIIGNAGSRSVQDAFVSGSTYNVIFQRAAWFRSSGNPTLVQEPLLTTQKYRYLAAEPRGLDSSDLSPSAAFIVEGNLLQ